MKHMRKTAQLLSGVIVFMIFGSLFLEPSLLRNSVLQTQTDGESGEEKLKEITDSQNPKPAITAEADLIARYTFDTPGDPGNDDSGNNHDALLHVTNNSNYQVDSLPYYQRVDDQERGAVLHFDDARGTYNKSMKSSGLNAYSALNDLSISLWIKVDQAPSNLDTLYTSYGEFTSTAQTSNRAWLYFTTAYNVQFNLQGTTLRTGSTGRTTFTFSGTEWDNWHHLVVVYRKITADGSLDLYIDGQLDSHHEYSYAVTANIIASNIGTRWYSTTNNYYAYEYDGSLDDFRLYNKTLSPAEVLEIYENGAYPTWYTNGTHTWNYRTKIDVAADLTQVDTNIQQTLNFTDQLNGLRFDGTIDTSSLKLLEYSPLMEDYIDHSFTFTPTSGDSYNARTNATGMLSWILNGTTGKEITDYPADHVNIRNWLLWGRPRYDLTDDRNQVPIGDFYKPNDVVKGNTWKEYIDTNSYVNFNEYYTPATDFYRQSTWALTYVYFPDDITNCYVWLYTDNRSYVYIDQYYDYSNPDVLKSFYKEYGVRDTSTHSYDTDLTGKMHVQDIGPMNQGWHTIMIETQQHQNDRYGQWGFSLNLSRTSDTITRVFPLEDLQITTRHDIWEHRTFYLYFNITEAIPAEKYNNNYFGNMPNAFSSMLEGPQVSVRALEYREYANMITQEIPWWNVDWSYRLYINISTNYGRIYSNHLMEETFDFTQIMSTAGISGLFDENSIRIIEWDEFFNTLREIPCQFDKDSNYVVENYAVGNVIWVVEGRTDGGRTRFYQLYFDTSEFDTKDVADYDSTSNLTITTNTVDLDYTVENDKILISMKKGAITPGQYADHIYQVYDKRTGQELQNIADLNGWGLSYWNYDSQVFSPFAQIQKLSVTSAGPVKVQIKMEFDDLNYDYIYERYYTFNYLDDTVQITHKMTARTGVSVTQGTWYFTLNWLNSERDTAFGVGGLHFGVDSNINFDGSQDFTSRDDYPGFTNIYTERFKPEGWYSVWDEVNEVGVGTIWDPLITENAANCYLDTIILQTGGLSATLYYRPWSLTSGTNRDFTMWGQIYAGSDGTITKLRASGLQYGLEYVIGAVEFGGGANLQIKILDSAAIQQSIGNAYVELRNSTNHLISIKQTDSIGNVTFKQLYDDTWNITIIYTVNTVNYTIYSGAYVLNTLGGTKYIFYTQIVCNLTTLAIKVTDFQVNLGNPGLYNANVTLVNTNTGQNITSFYTDAEGKVSIRVPITTYNFTVAYQGKLREYQLGMIPDFSYTKAINLALVSSVNFNCSIGFPKTELSIADVTVVSGWDFSSQLITSPYTISAYITDNITLDFYFEAISGVTLGNITGGVYGNWSLLRPSRGNMLVNSSADLSDFTFTTDSMDPTAGHYYLVIYGTEYYTDTYILKLQLEKTDYQAAYIELTINFQNFTTSLVRVDVEEDLIILWHEDLSFLVNFTSVLPYEQNISTAILYYSVVNRGITGQLTQESSYGVFGGIYNLTILDVILEVNRIYSIRIYGNATNFAYTESYISFQVLPRPTAITSHIDTDFHVSDTLLRGAQGEYISFQINYTKQDGSYLGAGASVTATIEEAPLDYRILYSTDQGNGMYSFIIPAINYNVLLYRMQVYGVFPDQTYVTQSLVFQMDILDYWDTSLTLIQPPTVYPWSNNASFKVRYACFEEPRINRLLSDAYISQLNLTYQIDTIEYNFLVLDESRRHIDWDWQDLSNGVYLITFNTSIVNLSTSTTFYAIPSIQTGVYRETTIKPYMTIYPVITTISLSIEDTPLSSLELFYTEAKIVNASLVITDFASVLKGKGIAGAIMTYAIYNDDLLGLKVVEKTLFDIGYGKYYFNLNDTTTIGYGSFTVKVSMVLENYSLSELATFTLKVLNQSLGVELMGDLSSFGILSKYIEDSWNITVFVYDISHGNISLTTATVFLNVTSEGYGVVLNSIGNGYYQKIIAWTEIDEYFSSIGSYSGKITIVSDYFYTVTRNIELQLNYRLISLEFQGDFIKPQEMSKVKGEVFYFRIQLVDIQTGLPIENAIVKIYFESLDLTITMTHIGDGIYTATESFSSVNAFVQKASLFGSLSIEAVNYQFTPISIFVTVEMSELITGIPTFYLLLIITSLVIIVGTIAGVKAIQYARIPAFVKLIDRLQKQIKANKDTSHENLTISAENEIIEKFEAEWRVLDLDIKSLWGQEPQETKTGFKSPSDQSEGGV